jgi:hypothetical protein
LIVIVASLIRGITDRKCTALLAEGYLNFYSIVTTTPRDTICAILIKLMLSVLFNFLIQMTRSIFIVVSALTSLWSSSSPIRLERGNRLRK